MAAPSPSTSSSSTPITLDTKLRPTADAFASAIASGRAREIACFGARGDGKSFAACWGMILHAFAHAAAGHPLPTIWLGIRDTLANHKLTTHKTLQSPAWAGRWKIGESGHRAVYTLDGPAIVQLELIGADSAADADKVRTECHGVWMDEAAPAMDMSNGLSDTIWFQAMSSQPLARRHPHHTRARRGARDLGALSRRAPKRHDKVPDPPRRAREPRVPRRTR